jgi:hypothetical protein
MPQSYRMWRLAQARGAGNCGQMAHNISDRKRAERTRALEREVRLRAEQAAAEDLQRARDAVLAFNARLAAGRRLLAIPTVQAALLSGHHWMQVTCGKCGTRASIDLSFRNPPPNTPVNYFLANWHCPSCEGPHPRPTIFKLWTAPGADQPD